MATIFLIRHGQAQFGMEEYDALSPTGIEQAKILGKSFVERKIFPNKIISGAMKRHQQTMDYCLKTMNIESVQKKLMKRKKIIAFPHYWSLFNYQTSPKMK